MSASFILKRHLPSGSQLSKDVLAEKCLGFNASKDCWQIFDIGPNDLLAEFSQFLCQFLEIERIQLLASAMNKSFKDMFRGPIILRWMFWVVILGVLC
jgi:hypothetical protein